MAVTTCNEGHGRRAGRVIAATAVLLALCATALLVGANAGPARAANANLIGKTKQTPKAKCPKPERQCQAVGRLTGFQARASGEKNPYVVPRSGELVAWSVDLTRKPKPVQRRVFGKLYSHKPFGEASSARITVLKKKDGKKFKLKSHSPAVDLTESIGEQPIITLGEPLRVKKGDVVAITLPTWTFAFAIGLPEAANKWRASRSSKRCEVARSGSGLKNLKKSKPQEKVGASRTYGCTYSGARLLYWGYFEPS